MATVEGSLIAVAVAAVTAVGTWLTATAQKPRKSDADEDLTREDIADRQVARLEAEVGRLIAAAEYLRESCREADRRATMNREGWWRTYRAAVEAGVSLGDDLHPPFNGDQKK